MKFCSIIFLFFLLVNSVLALDVPFLSDRVIDEVGILSNETRKSLEEKLKEHEKQTSNQIVVLIISSLEGEILEEYSLKVATTWKLGQKGKDNGVLLLIAKNDRQLRIEVGYGLEGILTDVLSNRIIRKEITPSFKQGNFSIGITRGVEAIIKSIQGTYENSGESSDGFENADFPLLNRLLSIGVFLFVMTPFTLSAIYKPYFGWILYFFLMPFYATFSMVVLGKWGSIVFLLYVVGVFILKIYLRFTSNGKKIMEKRADMRQKMGYLGFGEIISLIGKSFNGSNKTGDSDNSSSGWSSGSSGSSGGFSGGGGSFGGGGSSGSW